MAPLSDEENNYIRLALLLIGVSPRAVRTFFDKEFHPSNLHSTLNKNKPILHDLRLKKTLNSYQWNLLFPKNGLTNSSNFDVTMMIWLIRNLTPVTPPLTGFDSLPTQAETSPESDLARIKCYRNILAHLNSDTIDTVFFNTAWGDITEAVGRLGGQRMKHECQELKVKILDQSNQELMNEIKQSQREIRELQDIIKRLLNKVRRNCLSALDILGGQIKKQSNQEITIQIKKAEREIRELEDIMERLHNKLWRCQSGADIIDSTGDGVKDKRGNTQIVIDQTKDDFSKTRKRKHDNATEGIEASNGAIVPANTQEGRGQINQGFSDSGSFQSIQEDSLNSTKNKIEDNDRENKWHDNHGCADSGSFDTIPEDSFDSSIFTYTDITSTKYMMRPDVHVLKDKHDIPRFTTPIGEQQYQPRKTETAVGTPCGMNIEDVSYIASNGLFSKIDSTGGDSHFLDLEKNHKSKKNCPWRIIILIIVIGCISGVAIWVIQNKYVLGSKDTPTVITDDLPDFPDKCENDFSIARVGEQICIPYTQKFTSRPSGIHVRQLSSQYMSVLQGFAVNMSSDAFEQQNGGWIINFNSSRTDQQLRFMKGKATCDSVGIYEITVEYDDGNVSSSKFEIKLKDPQLQHSVTRINDSIHVHCEMIKTCVASSLALFVNDGGSSRMIPNINVCSDNHQESGTTVSADAIIPAAWFSGNMTISCIPLMTDPGLAANLTSTTRIPVCEGDCIPDCTDDPQSEAYFPDKNDCTKFYQCSNGKLVFQTCSSTTYWSPSKCTCDHFDEEICNKDTNKFFKPLLSIEKCTKASLV